MIVAPAGNVTVSLMLPVPVAVLPVTPVLAVELNVAPVKDEERVSFTVAPVTVLAPLLVTMIVYVAVPPGATVVLPLVLVIRRSVVAAVAPTVLEAVAELFPVTLSVTPA